MTSPLEWTESQIKSQSVFLLLDALRVNLGGVLVHWGPFASGKSHALKDLTVHLRRGENIAKYINARHFDRAVHISFGNFMKSELGLPLDRALGDICNLFPAVPAGKVKPTMIIDHIEDVMDQPDTQQVLTGFARECRETNSFKVLVCTSSLAHATSVLKWNGGTKFRLACWPCSCRWEESLLRLYLAGFASTKFLSKDELESVLSCAVICGSPGKVDEIVAASPKARLHLSSSTAEAWSEGFDALKYFAERDSAMGDPDTAVQTSGANDAVDDEVRNRLFTYLAVLLANVAFVLVLTELAVERAASPSYTGRGAYIEVDIDAALVALGLPPLPALAADAVETAAPEVAAAN
eukprot:CAMPEP_0172167284 /NCGR_PEP_ID=MMETSP1050-20130122/9485_1 /TAXON_ID=233186 /ORGANISM="Cryptomonas curvata, Strain CCAP979/52" /LENGTH=351 /DNA_ID=CAMNT_0012838055 /DNA_START=118 /DNA_END=1172 /DNA_ORIENTATION=-